MSYESDLHDRPFILDEMAREVTCPNPDCREKFDGDEPECPYCGLPYPPPQCEMCGAMFEQFQYPTSDSLGHNPICPECGEFDESEAWSEETARALIEVRGQHVATIKRLLVGHDPSVWLLHVDEVIKDCRNGDAP